MKNLDDYMPFILKPVNIARMENGKVYIGNRKAYPFTKEFVMCESVEDVAGAIEDMITQGGGPARAAMAAMQLLAAQKDKNKSSETAGEINKAVKRLQRTRPTNTTMARLLENLGAKMINALEDPDSPSLQDTVTGFIDNYQRDYERSVFAMAETGSSLIDDKDGILTMCFAETSFILTIALALEQGLDIKVYTPETRPYLQGARLTAPSLMDIGADVTLITDNMCAYVMSQGKIQKYMSAVDIITSDGWAANKIGTFQNAISANYHGIPYFPLAIDPDMNKKGREDIVIEERNPDEVKRIRDVLTTRQDLKAYYPAFDIIPPHLIAGVITPKGLISAYGLKEVYGG